MTDSPRFPNRGFMDDGVEPEAPDTVEGKVLIWVGDKRGPTKFRLQPAPNGRRQTARFVPDASSQGDHWRSMTLAELHAEFVEISDDA